LLKGPGELHNSVIKICQAKRIDPNMLMEAKLNAHEADVLAMKSVGPNAFAKA
jgi:hypothetical protein